MKPKRILILGPESTGKSSLAHDLAEYYGEPWVREYAREFLENLGRPYRYEDLSTIARGQLQAEDKLANSANKFLFCDTDLRVIHIWSDYKFGKTEPWILEEIAMRVYDFVFLCDIDLPWEEDPLREHPQPEIREELFQKYLQIVSTSGFDYQIISGQRQGRLQKAIQSLNEKYGETH
ncbi:AAA family ATPase [Algoriphagus namhaensis]